MGLRENGKNKKTNLVHNLSGATNEHIIMFSLRIIHDLGMRKIHDPSVGKVVSFLLIPMCENLTLIYYLKTANKNEG